jgi:hypothetical protein
MAVVSSSVRFLLPLDYSHYVKDAMPITLYSFKPKRELPLLIAGPAVIPSV